MSEKKQLLEEGTIRRFMQLANIKPLNEASDANSPKLAGGRTYGKAGQRYPTSAGLEEALEEELEEAKYEEGLEEAVEEGVDESVEEGLYLEEEEAGAELGGGEAEGGDLHAVLSKIQDGLNELIAMTPGGASQEFGLEGDEEEEEGGEDMPDLDMGGDDKEEELEEAQYEEGLEEAQYEEGLEEAKEYGKKDDKKYGKKRGKEEKENMEEALAEELTRRVAARLMAEMKKGGHGPGKVAGLTPAKKSKSAGHARNLTSGNVTEGGTGAKSAAPKGHGPGKVAGLSPAKDSKSKGHKRNMTTGNTVAGKKK